MRTTFVTFFIIISGILAAAAEPQPARVSINNGGSTIKNVLRDIEEQTDYLFVYDVDEVNIDRTVSLNVKDKSVAEVLDAVFKGSDISYAMHGNNIMLLKKNSPQRDEMPQQKVVRLSGKVVDQQGLPLVGVNVFEEGTNNGTITDENGNFFLDLEPGKNVEISCLGFVSQVVTVFKDTVLNIVLKEDTQALDEVVFVGFGTQKKVNLSGSVSSVNMNELAESRPVTNVSSALAGLAAGLQVTSSSNRPGDDNASLLVRGQGTLNNASPLVVIDGMEGSMNNVNVQDIESISVLKDASSAAIYGSRAANGVILITTKSGRAGSLKVSYNGYVSFQTIRPNVLEPVSNYADYMEYINEGYGNSNQKEVFSQSTIDAWRNDNGKNPLMYPNTNWIKEAFQTGVGTNHAVSMSGGSEKIQFYGAFGYFDNPGVLENAGYEKYDARLNLNANLTSWLKMGMNVNGFVGKADSGNAGQTATEAGEQASVGAFTWGWATTPAMILKHDGQYGGIQNPEDDVSESSNNILMALNSTRGDNTTRNAKSRFYVTLQPVKDLSVTGSYSYEFTNQAIKSIPVFHNTWNFGLEQIISEGKGQTYITQKDYKRERNYMDVVAKYGKRVVDERFGINVMLGTSQESYHYEWSSITRRDLIDPSLSVINAANGQISANGNLTNWVMRSYFGRLNLDWENKYLLELNFRTDGSSRFQKNTRWGYFPSGSIAWRLEQEEFMKDITWIDNLKVRASYGSLGNNSVGNYASISSYSSANYVINNAVATGLAMKNLANAGLEWEKTKVVDLGLDFAFLNNRLYGTFDWFDKKTEGILIALPAPAVHGSASIPASNAAQVSNKGIELSLGWRDRIGDFGYGINGNYTNVKNNVDKFKGEEYSLNGIYMVKEGLPINSMYMYVADKIVSTDADVAQVQEMLDKNPKAFAALGAVPQKGDILFKDMNNDGIIDPTDRDNVGSSMPKHMFGLTLTADYKGVDFSVFMQGVTGIDGYLNEKYFTTNVQRGYQLSKEIIDNRWTADNLDAKYPRLTSQTAINSQANTVWLQSKDYLKIRNIQLGYTFPKALFRRVDLQKLRVYGSLENFFTFTKYKGIDPELDNLGYPTMRQAVVGVSVEF